MSFIIFETTCTSYLVFAEKRKKEDEDVQLHRNTWYSYHLLMKKCTESNRDVRVMHVLQLSSFHKI